MSYRTFSSRAGLMVRISDRALSSALATAASAGARETGGIVIGFYSDHLREATITELAAPPSDSRATRFSFLRGVRGLLSRLNELWAAEERRYYLGEWHFHPFGDPIASDDDHDQMYVIARSPRYNCPEPILVILGGNPGGLWNVAVSIYLNDGGRMTLIERGEEQVSC